MGFRVQILLRVSGGSGVKLYLDFRGQAPVRKFLFDQVLGSGQVLRFKLQSVLGFQALVWVQVQAPVKVRVLALVRV